MRIGVCLTGVSYDPSRNKDWRNYVNNIKDTFGEVDYFTTTYNSEFNDEIIKLYNPKKFQFVEYGTQRGTYIKSLKQIDNDDVDFLICTRFDIFFNKNINELNIDYEKFNFLFKEKGNWNRVVNNINVRFVTDNFFAFPIKYKEIFIKAIEGLENSYYLQNNLLNHPLPFMHHVYDGSIPKLCDNIDYHFISDIEENSDINSFYRIR
jgi:hypothetical protein